MCKVTFPEHKFTVKFSNEDEKSSNKNAYNSLWAAKI